MKLPAWIRSEETQQLRPEFPDGTLGEEYSETAVRFRCDDPTEMAFAFRCAIQGFALAESDTWLAQLPDSEGKTMLLQVRADAKAAATHWEQRCHLQLLHANRQHVDRTDFLRPLAQRDAVAQRGRSKGGSEAAKVSKATAEKSKTKAVRRFKELIGAGNDQAEAIDAMTGEGWSRASLYRHLREERARLNQHVRKPVKRRSQT